jgi:hypothetical protein
MSLCELSVQNLEKHLIINWYNNKLSKSDCETEDFLSYIIIISYYIM